MMDEAQLNEIKDRLQILTDHHANGPWEFKQFSQFGGNKFILNTENDMVMMEIHWGGGFPFAEALCEVREDMQALLDEIDRLKEGLNEKAEE